MANVVSIERVNEHTRIEHMDDGTHVAILSAGQHFYNRDTAQYEDSDSTIQIDETVPGFTHNVKAGSARTRLADGGKFRFGLRHPLYVTYAPRGANAVSATVSGNKATYAGLWTSVDVELTKSPERTKEDLILLDASAPSSFTWDLEELAGVTPTMEADGSLSYVETLTGSVVGRIPAPTVEDAAGVQGIATMTYADGAITVAVDPAWLADPARVFPVTLDPTTLVLQPDPTAGKDTYVNQNAAAANFGTDANLLIGDDSIANSSNRSFLQPNVSSIPVGSTISSAQLQLYNAGSGFGAALPNATLYRLTATWDEATATWNLQPTFDATAISTVASISNAAGWVAWTGLATLVRNWVNGTWTNYGVLIKKATEVSAATDTKNFYSSDYATDSTLRPKWTIVYSHVPTTTAVSPTGTTAMPATITNEVTPRLSWTYSDPIGGAQSQYQVRLYDAANNLVYDTGAVSSANAYYDVVAAARLKYGTTYGWQVRVSDGVDWSGYTALTYFQCVMSAPVGFAATADAANAHTDLAWTAHTGENLAGYRVYRRPSGGTWVRLNRTLITTNAYVDDAAASGQAYDYYVTAVATDGYESPASATDTETVTFAGAWIDALQLEVVPRVFEAEDEWVGSVQRVLGRSTPVVFRRTASRKLHLSGYCTSKSDMDALRATLAPGNHRYVDALGEVYRFELTGPLSYPKQAPFPTAATTVYQWSFECVEVS